MGRIFALGLLVLAAGWVPEGRAQSAAITGVAPCDEQVRLWRACIAASNKSLAEKNTAYAEVNRFVNDVRTATAGNRRGLTQACRNAARGYRSMLSSGSCARGTTGLFDDVRRR